ncbi:MAG TPA: GntR family transcriptional regulator [Solirubrobacteraceae bacterium]|jgi:DNA-binding GntR family transcriptional regulator|nr:GntR family transcriptional regulator [Solirubrobacteraceae bacterium]
MGSKTQHTLSTGPTLADQAYRALREEIISGALTPGERLTERQLAERLGVSPTPVREALQRLEHEHLIQRTDTRRITVAEPSVRRLYELTVIEAALRGVGARLAAENATEKELVAIEQALAAFTKTPTPERVLAAARKLHELIDQASHNQTLTTMIATATAFDLQFRLDTLPEIFGTNRRMALDRHREHSKIVAAIKARDGETAETLMRQHILRATGAFLQASADREPG